MTTLLNSTFQKTKKDLDQMISTFDMSKSFNHQKTIESIAAKSADGVIPRIYPRSAAKSRVRKS